MPTPDENCAAYRRGKTEATLASIATTLDEIKDDMKEYRDDASDCRKDQAGLHANIETRLVGIEAAHQRRFTFVQIFIAAGLSALGSLAIGLLLSHAMKS